ncbi:MAG: hypothetical protein L0027_00990 [Candidatus Rokubacteria bacterium]|nr:hypothetical protein [Candidatus Rokubacteria bacterium]
MRHDRAECSRTAGTPLASRPIEIYGGRVWSFPYETVDPKLLDECMKRKGYTIAPY